MTQITVTAEIASAIAASSPPIVLVDPQGKKLGQMTQTDLSSASESIGPIGMTDEHLAEIKRRMAEDDGTRFTLAEIMERVQTLATE